MDTFETIMVNFVDIHFISLFTAKAKAIEWVEERSQETAKCKNENK